MNREIKFRAWDKKSKFMMYDIFKITEKTTGVFLKIDNLQDYEWMEYTGLKDKSNKEIYEGDLLKIYSIGEVIWWNKAGCWGWKPLDKHQPIENLYYNYDQDLEEFEVIGNVYENSDLLTNIEIAKKIIDEHKDVFKRLADK